MGRKHTAFMLVLAIFLSMIPANTLAAGEADLTLTVTDWGASTFAGSTVAYSITVVNLGPDTATGVKITATLPANTIFNISASTAGVSLNNLMPGGILTFVVGSLGAGASANVTIALTTLNPVPPGVSQIAFTASVASDGVAVDPNPANNTSSDTTPVQRSADLSVSLSDSPDPVISGQYIQYSASVINNGQDDTSGAVFSMTIPAGTSFDSPSSTPGLVYDAGAVTLPLGSMPVGLVETISINVILDASLTDGMVLSATATVAGSDSDPASGNNSDTVTTTVVQNKFDQSVSVSDSPDPVTEGGNITYSIQHQNAGPDAAANVVLSIPIPSGTTFQSCTIPAGYTAATPAVGGAGTVMISKPSMNSGESSMITLVLRAGDVAKPGAAVTMTATASANGTDTNPSNNSATAATYVNAVNHAPAVAPGIGSQSGTARTASSTGTPAAVPYTADVSGWFTDADLDALSYTVVSAVDGSAADVSGDVTLTGHTLTYTPAASQAVGNVTIVIKANDGETDSTGNVTVTVAVSNVPETDIPVSLYRGGRRQLVPEVPGGQWSYDAAMVKLVVNSDGSATVTGLQTGTTTVLYTTEASVTRYVLTVMPAVLPVTGQNYFAAYFLAALALLSALSACLLRLIFRKRAGQE